MTPMRKWTNFYVFEFFPILHSPYCYYYCFYFFLFFYFFFAFRRKKAAAVGAIGYEGKKYCRSDKRRTEFAGTKFAGTSFA